MVVEKSQTLRASKAGMIVQPNGWLALEQLGVAPALRTTSVPIQSYVLFSLFFFTRACRRVSDAVMKTTNVVCAA